MCRSTLRAIPKRCQWKEVQGAFFLGRMPRRGGLDAPRSLSAAADLHATGTRIARWAARIRDEASNAGYRGRGRYGAQCAVSQHETRRALKRALPSAHAHHAGIIISLHPDRDDLIWTQLGSIAMVNFDAPKA